MKIILLTFFWILIHISVFGQIENKLNIDFSNEDMVVPIDTNTWRLVEESEYDTQNPGALEFLKDPNIEFYNGYVLKEADNIMDPPVIMIQAITAPDDFSLAKLRSQADTIFNTKKLIELSNKYKKEGEGYTLLESLINSTTYFDEELEAIVIQMEVPAINGENNIIFSANFFDDDRLIMFKMIYLDESQKRYFNDFVELISSVELD